MRTRFTVFAVALATSASLSSAVVYAAADLPPSMLPPHAQTTPSRPPIGVTGIAAFNQARNAQATGLYHISTIRHHGGATLQVYGLLHNGQLLEVHGRKGGGWAAKEPGSTSIRVFSTAQFDQLLSLVGRDIRNASAADKARFTKITGLSVGSSTTNSSSSPPSAPAPSLPCKPANPNCADQRTSAPLRDWLDYAASAIFRSAAAAGELKYFKLDIFGIVYEYNEPAGYAGFKGFGIHAIWQLP